MPLCVTISCNSIIHEIHFYVHKREREREREGREIGNKRKRKK